jgi:hypothetical protein
MKNKLPILIAVATIILMPLFSIAHVGAVDIDPLQPVCDHTGISGDLCPDTDPTKLTTTIGDVVSYAFTAVGIVAAIFLIYGGITFALSGGNPEKVKKAKSTIIYSLIGLGLAVLANVITSLVVDVSQRFK